MVRFDILTTHHHLLLFLQGQFWDPNTASSMIDQGSLSLTALLPPPPGWDRCCYGYPTGQHRWEVGSWAGSSVISTINFSHGCLNLRQYQLLDITEILATLWRTGAAIAIGNNAGNGIVCQFVHQDRGVCQNVSPFCPSLPFLPP